MSPNGFQPDTSYVFYELVAVRERTVGSWPVGCSAELPARDLTPMGHGSP
jgi:hypothetical protein